jgi:hypothetical protein
VGVIGVALRRCDSARDVLQDETDPSVLDVPCSRISQRAVPARRSDPVREGILGALVADRPIRGPAAAAGDGGVAVPSRRGRVVANKALVSPVRTVKASGKATVTTITGFVSTPLSMWVGGLVTDSVLVAPNAARAVEVQSRRAGSTTFVTVTSGTTTTTGAYSVRYRPAGAGARQFRLVVRASSTALPVISATRTITAIPTPVVTPTRVVTPTPVDATAPGPVTGLHTIMVSATSVGLGWTNPTDPDFTGVMIRRTTGAVAPATPISGTLVTDTVVGVSSVTDTGLAPGTQYSYTAFPHDAIPNHASAAQLTTSTPVSAMQVHLCGAVDSDQTWDPTNAPVYVLDCTVTIPSGSTLTVHPGTIIKATNKAVLSVDGSLVGSGTAGSPVGFTSLLDDSVGGDTNGDGSAAKAAAGDWVGIVADALTGDPQPSVSLDHVVVRYPQTGLRTAAAAVAMTNSVAGSCSVLCVLVSGRGIGGIANSPDPTLMGNTFGSATRAAVLINAGSGVDIAKLGGNAFAEGSGFAGILFDGAYADRSGTFPATGSALLGLSERG